MRSARWTFVLLVAGGTALLFSACGNGRDGPPMMRMMGELPAGIAAEELPDPESRGARLVARYCSSCHGIPSTRRHSAEDWEASARRMFRRMRHMDRMGGMMGRMMGRMRRSRMSDVEAPTTAEERAIVAYLQDHAMRGTPEADLPVGEGRELFADRCARCHALPDPGQHTPEEWPAVVERMRENMRQMDLGGMSDGETEIVLRYLQEVASAAQR